MITIRKVGILILSIVVQVIFVIPRIIILILMAIGFLLQLFKKTISFIIDETEGGINKLNQ